MFVAAIALLLVPPAPTAKMEVSKSLCLQLVTLGFREHVLEDPDSFQPVKGVLIERMGSNQGGQWHHFVLKRRRAFVENLLKSKGLWQPFFHNYASYPVLKGGSGVLCILRRSVTGGRLTVREIYLRTL